MCFTAAYLRLLVTGCLRFIIHLCDVYNVLYVENTECHTLGVELKLAGTASFLAGCQ